jgi:chloramphenicol O-acetyltransferase
VSSLDELLERYQGRLLDVETVSEYEQWALQIFHDRSVVADPSISLTLQLDITEAEAVYRRTYAQTPHASLTAYLTWQLLVALRRQPSLNWRRLEGRWYEFDNLPLFFPVAVGGNCRFQDVLLEDVAQADWPSFCRSYGQALSWTRSESRRWGLTVWSWSVATFIGNLPYLRFQSLTVPVSALWSGRPSFYFGKRVTCSGDTTIPLAVTIDHSNGDPYVLDGLFRDYSELLITP